jgi:phosphatidate cytidylyltransferase
LFEWNNLLPSTSVQDCKRNDEVENTNPTTNERASTRSSIQQSVVSILFNEKWQKQSDLEKYQFYVFSFFSWIVTMVPTSTISMTLMYAGITLRILQFMPTFPKATKQSIHIMQSTQHYQFGLVYISVGFHFLLQICQEGGPIHIGYLLFIVWMSDTGALILGRLMRKKTGATTESMEIQQQWLFQSFLKSISPGKTMPGLAGAMITGPVSAILYPIDMSGSNISILSFTSHLSQKVVLGLVLSIVGIIGDLAESSVKRMSGKKDSGGLLPGHGGVVDRFDSLFTAGTVYYYLVLA